MPPERARGSLSVGSSARAYRSQERFWLSNSRDGGPFLRMPGGGASPSNGFMPESLFREIYENYGARMRQLAYRITRNEADADDALQDALMRIYEKYGTFRHESSLWTWVYRVTQTSALMILKKKRSQGRIAEASRTVLDSQSELSRSVTPEHALVQARLLEALQEGLDSLIPSLRAPMRTYLCAGLNQRELCEHTGLSLLATKARLHRARVTLRRHLVPHLRPGSTLRTLSATQARAR